jgi:hypothetical protein
MDIALLNEIVDDMMADDSEPAALLLDQNAALGSDYPADDGDRQLLWKNCLDVSIDTFKQFIF